MRQNKTKDKLIKIKKETKKKTWTWKDSMDQLPRSNLVPEERKKNKSIIKLVSMFIVLMRLELNFSTEIITTTTLTGIHGKAIVKHGCAIIIVVRLVVCGSTSLADFERIR